MVKTQHSPRAGTDRSNSDLLAAAADWLWECDAAGRIDFLSPEFEASTGLLPQSLLGKRLAELAAVDTASAIHAEQRAAIAAQKPFRDLVVKLERGDGTVIWIEIVGTPLFDAGAVHGYRGIGRTVTARVEAMLALQRYRQLVDVASDWFSEMDAHNRIVYISPNVEAVLGLPASAYIGKRLTDTEGVVIEPEAGKATLAAIKARQPYRDFVYHRKLTNGKIVWVSANGVPFHGEDGTFLGYRGIARDISGQIEAERKLRESEARFRRMYEIGADYYWEQDTKHRLTYVSPESVHDAIYGVPFSQLRGKRPTETLTVGFESESGMRALLAFKARQPFRDVVFSVRHADGQVRWASVSGAPRFDENGEYLGHHGTGVEITARKDAEAAAHWAQRRLHDAVAHVTQPFVVYDADNCIGAFNLAFANVFRTETRNTPVRQGLPFPELAEWQVRMEFYAAGPGEQAVDFETLLAHHQTEHEHTYHLRDGRWMLVIHHRLPGGGRVGLWTDVTAIKRAEAERRALEQQLHHSQRLESLGTLAGGVAHELNNMLVPVVALTKLVAGKLSEGSRERRNLDTVVGTALRARDLVGKILAFSRLEGEERRESVDLGQVLHEAVDLMRATVPTSIRIEEAIVPTPPVAADAGQLQQVIVNLVTNAAQAIGETTGTIGVRLEPMADGEHIRLSISDTGCGMDEATAAQIFDPFFTTKKVGEGTGLGLSVAHGIVKAHGGRIEVQSRPGQGTRFDIVLPTTSQANQAA